MFRHMLFRIIRYSLLPLTLAACCYDVKCHWGDDTDIRIVLADATSGEDLLSDSSKHYQRKDIRSYSIRGTDTLFYRLNYYAPDTLRGTLTRLQINMRYPMPDTVYLRLSDTDVDTIQMAYLKHPGTDCCHSYFEALPYTYNGRHAENTGYDTWLLKK